MYDPHTRESRGFGFVTMESAEEADAAIAGLNGQEINGKVIAIEKVCPVLLLSTASSHKELPSRPDVDGHEPPHPAVITDHLNAVTVRSRLFSSRWY